MNVVVIGLGSMGKRRIRLIRELYPDIQVFGIDKRKDRCIETVKKFAVQCFSDFNLVTFKVDCVFVCTSPLTHNNIIREALKHKTHVFTELNLVDDGYIENMKLAKAMKVKLFLSSTFLYRDEIKYIKEKVTDSKRWNYIYHIGQYLPNWHPWESYKDFFLGEKKTNGCREILAIELPWIISVFGNVVDYRSLSDKITTLDIDYDDNFMIQLKHENGSKGCLVVDVVSPYAVRNLEIYSEHEYISWNGTPESLLEYNKSLNKLNNVKLLEQPEHIDGYETFIVENAYKNEIKAFFDAVLNDKDCIYGFEKDKDTLSLIDILGA